MKLFEKIVNSLEPLTIFPKNFILDIWPEAPEAIKKWPLIILMVSKFACALHFIEIF